MVSVDEQRSHERKEHDGGKNQSAKDQVRVHLACCGRSFS
jgi:hypothetical protein